MRHWSGIVSRRLRCLLSLELTQTNLFDYTLDDDYSKDRHFDIIIANINRNILVNDMPAYAAALNPGGSIFFSGFYESKDLEIIKSRAAEFGLKYQSHKAKNDWCAMKAVKC